MDLPHDVILLDSLGDLRPENPCPILVCGSHCGGDVALALQVKSCNINAVFLNNAGVGKNMAGIRGLQFYEECGILACAVDHTSAEIGIARDTWESGIISHINNHAQQIGINIGDSVKHAVSKIMQSSPPYSWIQKSIHSKLSSKEEKLADSTEGLKKQTQVQINGISVTVTNSITFLHDNNVGDIVVCGSHGGLSAGEYAQKHRVKAVFFNDAGIGKNNAGIKSLELLSSEGILACTVDCMSAEIFNGQDVLTNGVISVCNQLAQSKNIKKNMMVAEAILFV